MIIEIFTMTPQAKENFINGCMQLGPSDKDGNLIYDRIDPWWFMVCERCHLMHSIGYLCPKCNQRIWRRTYSTFGILSILDQTILTEVVLRANVGLAVLRRRFGVLSQ